MSGIPTNPHRIPASLCLAALCLACAPDLAERPAALPFPRAYFHEDCAPWDGPALSVVFSHDEIESPFEERYPSLRIASYRPPNVLAGGSFEWAGEAQDLGYAAWCDSGGSCQAPASVRVRLDRAQPSRDVLSGEVWVELEPGRVLSGVFEARRLQFQALCG